MIVSILDYYTKKILHEIHGQVSSNQREEQLFEKVSIDSFAQLMLCLFFSFLKNKGFLRSGWVLSCEGLSVAVDRNDYYAQD